MEDKIQRIEYLKKQAIHSINDTWEVDECIDYLDEAFALCDYKTDLGYYAIISDCLNGLTYQTKNAIQTSKVRKAYEQLFNYLMEKYKNIVYFEINGEDEEEKIFMIENSTIIVKRIDYLVATFVKAMPSLGLIGLGVQMSKLKKQFYPVLGNAYHYTILIWEKYAAYDSSLNSLILEAQKAGKTYINWR